MKEFLCIVMLLYVHKLLHEKEESTETNCLYINNKFDSYGLSYEVVGRAFFGKSGVIRVLRIE
jgi:hypothetical protein